MFLTMMIFCVSSAPVQGDDNGQSKQTTDMLERVVPEFKVPVLPLGDVLDMLYVHHGVRVNMESIVYDYSSPDTMLSLDEAIERLERKEMAMPLEQWESQTLAQYRDMAQRSPEPAASVFVGVDYRLIVNGFSPEALPAMSVCDLLDELVRRDPDYQWESPFPGTARVFPAGTAENRYARSILGWEFPAVSTGDAGMRLTDFLAQKTVAEALEKRSIVVANSQWLTGDEKTIVTIRPDTTARDALDQIAAGMGPEYSWYLHNTTGNKVLTFNTWDRNPKRLNPNAEQPSEK